MSRTESRKKANLPDRHAVYEKIKAIGLTNFRPSCVFVHVNCSHVASRRSFILIHDVKNFCPGGGDRCLGSLLYSQGSEWPCSGAPLRFFIRRYDRYNSTICSCRFILGNSPHGMSLERPFRGNLRENNARPMIVSCQFASVESIR